VGRGLCVLLTTFSALLLCFLAAGQKTGTRDLTNVPILICECGLRVKAPGARPGRVGRCPRCGGRLVLPEEAVPPREPRRDRSNMAVEQGYLVAPQEVPAPTDAVAPRRKRRRKTATGFAPIKRPPSVSDGFLAPLDNVESSPFASIAYPLRGAECLGVLGILSVAFWVFGILVPEYCLTLVGDADSMGVPTLGKFIALISFLPVAFLSPFALIYWLQYLGRVLVSSAVGETCPPRSPDRNFDGFTTGLSPWLAWLVLGVAVGLAPGFAYGYAHGSTSLWNRWAALGIAVLGLPYILMALMLSFLHDDDLAATPWRVVAAFGRVALSIVPLCLFVAGLLAFGAGAFVLALFLREHHFWIYVAVSLANSALILWVSAVVMRVLGVFYYHHHDSLRWHRASPRWGVAWRL
jgi:hypothetical protein